MIPYLIRYIFQLSIIYFMLQLFILWYLLRIICYNLLLFCYSHFLLCPGNYFLFVMLYQNEYYTHYFVFQVITSFISSRFGIDYKNYCYHCTTISIILFVSFPLFVSIFCWFDFFLSLPFNPLWLLLKFFFFFGFYYLRANASASSLGAAPGPALSPKTRVSLRSACALPGRMVTARDRRVT